jgi:hypothetical protein
MDASASSERVSPISGASGELVLDKKAEGAYLMVKSTR